MLHIFSADLSPHAGGPSQANVQESHLWHEMSHFICPLPLSYSSPWAVIGFQPERHLTAPGGGGHGWSRPPSPAGLPLWVVAATPTPYGIYMHSPLCSEPSQFGGAIRRSQAALKKQWTNFLVFSGTKARSPCSDWHYSKRWKQPRSLNRADMQSYQTHSRLRVGKTYTFMCWATKTGSFFPTTA